MPPMRVGFLLVVGFLMAGHVPRASVAISTRKSLQSLALNGGIWIDADSTNNRWSQG